MRMVGSKLNLNGNVSKRILLPALLLHKPPLSSTPLIRQGLTNQTRNQFFQEQFQSLLEKGAIEAKEKESPDFFSRLFVVPKPSNQWRTEIDLSSLNDFIKIPKFKMDTPQKIRASMKKDHWVLSLDLKEAYFQILIPPRSSRYIRMQCLGKIYQYKALPFGICMAPWFFTIIVNVVKSLFHQSGKWKCYYDGLREYHRQRTENQFVNKTFCPTGYLQNMASV